MRVVPLVVGAALAVSACSGGSTTDSNQLTVENLTVQNVIIEEALPVGTNDISDAPSQPQAVEADRGATAPTVRNGDTARSTPEASGRTEAPPKTEPASEPDPHAGHDMNSMNDM